MKAKLLNHSLSAVWIALFFLGCASPQKASTPAISPQQASAAPPKASADRIERQALRPANKRKASRGIASLNTRTLTVTKEGTGTGTVTSRPDGINCGTTCSADFRNSREVRVIANADVGSTFVDWSMLVCRSDHDCRGHSGSRHKRRAHGSEDDELDTNCKIKELPRCGANAECKIKLTDDVTVFAQFDKIVCPSATPFLCSDGNCAVNEAACSAACPSGEFTCPDGSCAPSEAACNSGCTSGTVPCPLDATQCIPPGGTCTPQPCPADAPYRCPTTGVCVPDSTACN